MADAEQTFCSVVFPQSGTEIEDLQKVKNVTEILRDSMEI